MKNRRNTLQRKCIYIICSISYNNSYCSTSNRLKKMFTLHEQERRCHLDSSKEALDALESSAGLQLLQLRSLASAKISAAEKQIRQSEQSILDFHRLTQSARQLVTERSSARSDIVKNRRANQLRKPEKQHR